MLTRTTEVSTLTVAQRTTTTTAVDTADLVRILVGIQSGRRIPFKVSISQTVGVLKALIEQEEGTPADRQRILFRGRELENGRSLEYYEIKPQDVVHLGKACFLNPPQSLTVSL